MQSNYPEFFSREMGATEAEWLRWLPAALGDVPWQQQGRRVEVHWAQGHLAVQWETRPDRVIAQIRMPVLAVQFAFTGRDAQQRYEFMKRFDLYMQRGGG